ncbi:MAG: hypothetical protein SGI89_09325 [bacterium]|nr:hypothetical protein [bacterium]
MKNFITFPHEFFLKFFQLFLSKARFLLILPFAFSGSLNNLHSQPPVYLTFTTHNEDAEPYNTNFNYYNLRRNLIIQLADLVSSRGAKWNFQSDWRFLLAVKKFDTGSVVFNTNGKNIIRWLIEDRGIDCDPHSHEANGYNYADVAYLHSQLGIVPSKVVGGFLYNVIVNNNNWENLQNGIYGRMYPTYFWKPEILWGGGTQNHINDPQNFGAWKPQSMANYYVHDSTKDLTLIGNGCNNKFFDTTLVTTVVQRIRNLVNAISYNAFPDTGFYTATVHTQMGQLNTSQINKVVQFIDSMNVFVAQGKVIWKNLDDIYSIWNNDYGKKPFWTSCSQLPASYGFYNIKLIPEGFYSPPYDFLNIEDTVTSFLRNISTPYSIVDSADAVIDSVTFTGNFVYPRAVNGTYYIQLDHRNCIDTWSKAGGQAFVTGSTMTFDFTSSQSQAFGNNLKSKNGKFCIYSGDCNSDDIIDVGDVILIYNDANSFVNGYAVTDITGDLTVDVSDLLICYNNSFDLIAEAAP